MRSRLIGRLWRRGLCTTASTPTTGTSLHECVGALLPVDRKFVPEGEPKPIKLHFEISKSRDLLIRDIDAKLNDELDRNVDSGRVIRKFATYLTGSQKCGKSATLFRLVEQRRKAGWLVFYIRDAFDWNGGLQFYCGAYDDQAERDQGLEPLWYDRPTQTVELLKAFKKAHASALGNLPARLDTTCRAQMGGKSLLDLVDYGLNLWETVDEDWFNIPRLIGDVLETLIEEILVVEEFPVLIAVDSFQMFFGTTRLFNHERKRILAQALRVSWPIRDPVKTAERMKNGVYIAAQSVGHAHGLKRTDGIGGCKKVPATPAVCRRIRVDRGDSVHVAQITKGIRTEVPRFSLQETSSFLHHMHSTGIVSEAFTNEHVCYVQSLTQGNPREMLRIVRTL